MLPVTLGIPTCNSNWDYGDSPPVPGNTPILYTVQFDGQGGSECLISIIRGWAGGSTNIEFGSPSYSGYCVQGTDFDANCQHAGVTCPPPCPSFICDGADCFVGAEDTYPLTGQSCPYVVHISTNVHAQPGQRRADVPSPLSATVVIDF